MLFSSSGVIVFTKLRLRITVKKLFESSFRENVKALCVVRVGRM
jgi:hypothetical protein